MLAAWFGQCRLRMPQQRPVCGRRQRRHPQQSWERVAHMRESRRRETLPNSIRAFRFQVHYGESRVSPRRFPKQQPSRVRKACEAFWNPVQYEPFSERVSKRNASVWTSLQPWSRGRLSIWLLTTKETTSRTGAAPSARSIVGIMEIGGRKSS